jgi:hypothetical protein
MTKKQMSDQVQYWLGLQDVDAYNEMTLVGDLIYQGTIDLLARTKCVVRCVDLRVTAGVDTYKLDHSLLALYDLEDGNLPKARRDESLSPSFTLIRSDILRVAPVPSEDGEVQTWAVLRPAQMDGDTQSVGDETYGGIPDEFQDAIVTYALWKGSDYADDQTGQQGERYRMLYEGQDGRGGRIAQIKMATNKRGTNRAPGRRVKMRGVLPRGAWVG